MSDGQHRNPRGQENYFTASFFHRPEERVAEIDEAGLDIVELAAIQGPGLLGRDFPSRWSDPERRTRLLELIRSVEHEKTMLGISYHTLQSYLTHTTQRTQDAPSSQPRDEGFGTEHTPGSR